MEAYSCQHYFFRDKFPSSNTYIHGDDVRHCKEGGNACANFRGESCALDFLILMGVSIPTQCPMVAGKTLTWPDPSRRNTRPKVDRPMAPFNWSK
jgi:hypothetical protein